MGFSLIKVPADLEGSATPAILMGLFIAFGGILFGYDTGTIGGILAMDYWVDLFATEVNDEGQKYITTGQQGLIVSMLSVGTFAGALSGASIGDRIGRRWGLLVACIVFNIGVVMQTIAIAIPLFTAGRGIAGLGVGLLSVLVPLYQSECSPKWIRGTIVSAYQLALTIGLLLAAVVNNATHARNDSGSYRIPTIIQALWGLILAAGLIYLPETPRYFVKRGQQDKAAHSLSRLRRLPADARSIKEELAEIVANHEYELSLGKSGWLDVFQNAGRQRRRLLTGMAVMAGSQLTGINFIFYYGTQFFKNSGIENPFLIGLTTNLVNVVSTIPGLVLVERWGRRPILLFGAIGMTVCEFIVAIVGVTSGSEISSKVLIAFTCFYIFFFAISWGPVGWVVVGENFSLRFRAKSVACSIASNWIFNWAIGYATPYLVDEAPGAAGLKAKVFFIWGTCCLGCAIFVYFCIFETKGLTLEQVDEMYEHVPHAWQSSTFKPTIRFEEVRRQSIAAEEPRKQSIAHVESVYAEKV
ncbi:Plasma membrane low glucose sensor [Coniosporium apollinis]|uniref:Plasma membrane low glucose sensor n=2 Tax=Coniosporium TaxID=2810619 RepID=A0ABQ9NWE3_9PEZI|nr:Plasma membrane low glucose sensor [Cladosporium sp. JES 115]KAJ9666705.1 Plasma membrane low glucose sensor [Coniosporium apollinis]